MVEFWLKRTILPVERNFAFFCESSLTVWLSGVYMAFNEGGDAASGRLVRPLGWLKVFDGDVGCE